MPRKRKCTKVARCILGTRPQSADEAGRRGRDRLRLAGPAAIELESWGRPGQLGGWLTSCSDLNLPPWPPEDSCLVGSWLAVTSAGQLGDERQLWPLTGHCVPSRPSLSYHVTGQHHVVQGYTATGVPSLPSHSYTGPLAWLRLANWAAGRLACSDMI